ncbi:MAG: cobalamin B12-binding domain-containing protein [Verrucomicrobiota bacterium]|nr:cobalamin B12-binding domain-containing protein [Verrucomicrobiota bacterium]
MKVFLGNTAGQFATSSAAPFIVVATPAGQLHELGAVMINAVAAQLGWRTIYLGANPPSRGDRGRSSAS